MSLIPGYKFENIGKPVKGLCCKDATFTKFGKEIKVHDFIQEGRDGTIAKEMIERAGGLNQLQNANKELPTSDVVIDMNLDPITANRIIKCGQIAEKELKKQLELAEKTKQLNEIKKTKGEENE